MPTTPLSDVRIRSSSGAKGAIAYWNLNQQCARVPVNFNRQAYEKGRPVRHEVRFGPVTYFDLNGDGMIDCWVDQRNNKRESFILFERQVLKIEDPKGTLFDKLKGTYEAWGDGRRSQYEFIVPVGKWTLAKP